MRAARLELGRSSCQHLTTLTVSHIFRTRVIRRSRGDPRSKLMWTSRKWRSLRGWRCRRSQPPWTKTAVRNNDDLEIWAFLSWCVSKNVFVFFFNFRPCVWESPEHLNRCGLSAPQLCFEWEVDQGSGEAIRDEVPLGWPDSERGENKQRRPSKVTETGRTHRLTDQVTDHHQPDDEMLTFHSD